MRKSKKTSMVLSLALCLSLLLGVDGVLAAPPDDAQQKIRDQIEATEIVDDNESGTLREVAPDGGDIGVSDGTSVTIPENRSRAQWAAPLMFKNSSTLTSENMDDMYIFTTTSAKAPFIKLTADNPNYAVQLYQLDTATGSASPLQFYDFAGDDAYAYATNLPAGTFLWRVYSINGTVGDPYTVMVNCTNDADYTVRLSVSSDLQACTLLYGARTVTYNGTDPVPSNVTWKREVDGIGVFELQEITFVDYGDIAGIYYGNYDSTNFRTNNAIFFELKVEPGIENQQNPLWHYYQTGGSAVGMDDIDVTGLKTPRRLNLIDTTDYRYPSPILDVNGDPKSTHFALVYDIETGTFIDFASKLNGYYLYDNANSEEIFAINYRVIIR